MLTWKVIIEKHCVSCHAEEPSNMAFAIAPNGIMLDTIEKIITHKDQIYKQAVLSKAMPIINTTNMTDEEREKLDTIYEDGTKGVSVEVYGEIVESPAKGQPLLVTAFGRAWRRAEGLRRQSPAGSAHPR